VWLLSGHYSGEAALVWLTRNTVSIVLIGIAARRIGHLAQTWWRQGHSTAAVRAAWNRLPPARQAEYAALLAASAAAYYLAFGLGRGLPVAFTLIVVTIWAGLRTATTFVILHDLTFGTVAVLFTLHGDGPFAAIGSNPMRALIAQLFVGTVAVVGLVLALSRDERDALTAQLREQAQLMTTIVDNVAEGIGVVDEHGRFRLRNPAVGRLLGGMTSPTGYVQAVGYYGLFHPDGTPVAEEELPYRRALAGEQLPAMDILIRNPGVPEGRIVNLSATLMPGRIDGLRHAVVVVHDVTADRRHRDELASFAGVVAHDLLNPLTTIAGAGEILRLSIVNPNGPTTTGLSRIKRATARMGTLINDLLAYTTSRDAALSRTGLELNGIVGDIVTGRIDHAESTGADPCPNSGSATSA
jgi:signal transduction histidine kinase